ncbi:MAG: ABC transporter permease [Pirellulaceae bacterium]
MSLLKIAWRSIQHRGLGSLLTIISMALGVMMVVSVLSINGLVSESFRSNSSFGYDLIVGARGGGTQLTLSSVFYLGKTVETVPYEYYLAFCDQKTRAVEFRNSIAVRANTEQQRAIEALNSVRTHPVGGGWGAIAEELAAGFHSRQQIEFMQIDERGLFSNYVNFAIPILLGDTYQIEDSDAYFKACATNKNFFELLTLSNKQKFTFAQGRPFDDADAEVGYFGCVMGSAVARASGKKIGDQIKVTHGIPGTSAAHLHDQLFTIVGILDPTGTPNDKVVFVNMEGFYLINDHVKPIEEEVGIKFGQNDEDEAEQEKPAAVDEPGVELTDEQLATVRLPVEQRELTALLVSVYDEEGFGITSQYLQQPIEQGNLASTLSWSQFRPLQAQTSAQCVNPVQEVAKLFAFFVAPAKWILLALTTLICIVSGLSILVGIYNSMSQRHHEIAVMRALGARRSHVMLIMLAEAILLSLAGGALGWFGGHTLNAALSPIVENQTGVPVRFWDLAPPEQIFSLLQPALGNSEFAAEIVKFQMSPELLLIPGLILLAVLVGVYPAISAYRTDVAKSLGK